MKIAVVPIDISFKWANKKAPHVSLHSKTSRGTLSDLGWFNGSVVKYDLKCKDCSDGKIIFYNHIDLRRNLTTSFGMFDYHSSIVGGFVQQYQSILKMRHNGSIQNIANMPGA